MLRSGIILICRSIINISTNQAPKSKAVINIALFIFVCVPVEIENGTKMAAIINIGKPIPGRRIKKTIPIIPNKPATINMAGKDCLAIIGASRMEATKMMDGQR